MPRDQAARILGVRRALQHRLGQITCLCGDAKEEPDRDAFQRRPPKPREDERRDADGAGEPAIQAGIGLGW